MKSTVIRAAEKNFQDHDKSVVWASFRFFYASFTEIFSSMQYQESVKIILKFNKVPYDLSP